MDITNFIDQVAAGDSAGAKETINDLISKGQKIPAELQAKYEELNSKYIRLAADFDNFRKRQAQERENLLKYGAENTLKQLIEVLDNFDRGQKAVENVEDCQKVKESFKKEVFNCWEEHLEVKVKEEGEREKVSGEGFVVEVGVLDQ